MSNVTIRKAVNSDIPYLYEICLKTGDNGNDATDLFFDPYLIGQYYAAPYLFFKDGICFIAEYEYHPQGYIIAVPATDIFNKWMEEQWLPPLRKMFPQPFPSEKIRSEKEDRIIKRIHEQHHPADAEDWLTDYPAHLHIDLLPSLQGKGMGRALIDTLFAELKKQGVPGLHLGVSGNNTGAVAFYRKLGFSSLKDEEWGFVMGKLCN